MKKSFRRDETAVGMAAVLLALLVGPGCPSATKSGMTTATPAAGQSEQSQFRGPLLRNALHVLNHLEQFDEQPALEQVVDRLNQWARSQDVEVTWSQDPLIAKLPKKYQSAVWLDKLQDKSYDHDLDGDFLKEATWLRDISNHARGRDLDDLAVATALFDWTIRNVALIDPPKQPYLQIVLRRTPAEVLLHGQGTDLQRTWVFMLLGRQQGLDIVMLVVPDPDRPDQPRPWLPALLHKGQLYLFDTALGLSIPGPGGKGIATLTQAAEDESVLASLDLDESHHYPFKAAEAKQVSAFIEASPGYLARRMKVLESQLVGEERVVLSASPTDIAKRLKEIPHLASDATLWSFPYDTYALRDRIQTAPPGFKELLAMEMAPFTVPGYHGSRSTILQPGERQQALDELIRQGESPDQRLNTVITPGKSGPNSKIVFSVTNESPVRISFVNNSTIAEGQESVQFDNTNAAQPKIVFQIVDGKTTANDIVKAVANDPVASQILVATNASGSNGQGMISAADAATTARVAFKRAGDIKRPTGNVFPLWAGRLLHFRGVFDGEAGAKHFYMAARPGRDQLGEHVGELINDFQTANKVEGVPPALVQKYSYAVFARKQDATYWLGLISFDEGQYLAAEDYFRMVPLEVQPGLPSPWAAAEKYSLARTYEADGRTADAIKLLEEDVSPQRFGNRLRARSLKQAVGDKGGKPSGESS